MAHPPSPILQPGFPVARTITTICAIVIAESLLATILFPFIYPMVRRFEGVDEQYVGFWAGVITSSFFLSQTLTATLWGVASDKFGRKPVMILGLVGGAVGIISFGFSKSLIWATLSRAICGLFNGNAGVSRTAIGELASHTQLDQGKTYSLFGLCSAIGYIVGPLIGGYLSIPGDRFSSGGPRQYFSEYPYLLACLVGSCYNILLAGFSMLLLRETNPAISEKILLHKATPSEEDSIENGVSERHSLLARQAHDLLPNPETQSNIRNQLSKISCLAGIMLLAFHAIIFDEIYPIYASATPPYGLGLLPSGIAFSLSVMGPVLIVAALVLFPFLSSRFPALSLWRTSAMILAVTYPLFSFLPDLASVLHTHEQTSKWIALFALLGVRFAANVIAYTSMGILLNNVVSPSSRGALMGIAQTGMSFGRAVGPAIGGSVWSWSLGNGLPAPLDSHFLFLLELFLAMLQFATSAGIEVRA